ncbi:hypothetical protein R1flu_012008 [Riccia fluitans]|uniref:Ribosomal protein S10 n=1 Tax=Riccia fluitans TaxID=41844 RepID=A0ABD1Z9E0_9MARC
MEIRFRTKRLEQSTNTKAPISSPSCRATCVDRGGREQLLSSSRTKTDRVKQLLHEYHLLLRPIFYVKRPELKEERENRGVVEPYEKASELMARTSA